MAVINLFSPLTAAIYTGDGIFFFFWCLLSLIFHWCGPLFLGLTLHEFVVLRLELSAHPHILFEERPSDETKPLSLGLSFFFYF